MVAPHVVSEAGVTLELAEAHGNPDKVVCGYLLKRGGGSMGLGRGFKDRYVVLDGGILSYYNKETDYDAKKKANKGNAIPLEHYAIVRGPARGGSDADLNFQLVPMIKPSKAKEAGVVTSSSGKPRVFEFQAAKPEDRDAWMECFRRERCRSQAELAKWLGDDAALAKLRIPPGPDPIANIIPDAAPVAAAPASGAEAKPEAEAEADPVAEAEAEADPAPDAQAEADPKAEAEAAPQAEAEAEADPKAGAEAKPEAEAEAEAKPEAEAEAEAEAKPEAEAEAEAKPEAEAEAEAKPEAEAEAEAKPEAGAAEASASASASAGEAAASSAEGSVAEAPAGAKTGSLFKRAEKKDKWERRDFTLDGPTLTYAKAGKVRRSKRNPVDVSGWVVQAPSAALEDKAVFARVKAAKRLTPAQAKTAGAPLNADQAAVFLILRPRVGGALPFYFEAGSAEERDDWAAAIVAAGAGQAEDGAAAEADGAAAEADGAAAEAEAEAEPAAEGEAEAEAEAEAGEAAEASEAAAAEEEAAAVAEEERRW